MRPTLQLLSVATAALALPAAAQTFNPNQIRPCGTNGYVLTTSGGVTTCGPVSASAAGTTGAVQVAGSMGQLGAANFAIDPTTGNAFTGPIVRTLSSWFPQQPLGAFRTQMTNASNSLIRVLMIGDSITAGYATPVLGDTYAYQFKKWLQGGRDGGSGLLTVGFGGGATPPTSDRPEWSQVGSWTQVNDLGPSQSGTGYYGAIWEAAGTANTLTTSTVRGTTVAIDYEETTDNAGCSVTIDGTNVGNVDTANNSTPIVGRSLFTVGAGTHQVSLAPSGTGKCYLYGVEGVNTTGVVVDNMGIGFMRSEAFGTNPATQLAFVPSITPIPNLVVIDLGVNDSANGTGTTQAQYNTHMLAIIAYLEALNPQVSILIVDNYDVGEAGVPPALTQPQIRSTEQQIANADTHVSYMSMHDIWQSVANANALGLLFTDSTHPSNAGGESMGYEVASQIIGRPSSSAGTITFNSLFPTTVSSAEQFPSTYTGVSAPATNQFDPGINFSQSLTNPGYASGITLGNFGAGTGGTNAGFYLTLFTPNSGFRFCGYAGGTVALTSLTQTNCLTIPRPTANAVIPTLPATVTNTDQSFSVNTAPTTTVNAVNAGLNFSSSSSAAGVATGVMEGAFSTNAYGDIFYMPTTFTGGWKFCSYPYGTPVSTLTNVSACTTVPTPTTNSIIAALPSTVTTPEQNLTYSPAIGLTANAINPGFNFATGTATGYAAGATIGYDGTNVFSYFFRPSNQQPLKSCTYTTGSPPTSMTALTCAPMAVLTANAGTSLPLTQLASGTPTAGKYPDGGGSWTQVPPTRAGTVTISSSTTAAVTFTTAMTVAPTSCTLNPSASSAATGQPFATAFTTAGFTANVPISGTLGMTYQCVVNNAN
jgi:lysophospholipase L1-like esterase